MADVTPVMPSAAQPVSIGFRVAGQSWTSVSFTPLADGVAVTDLPDGGRRIVIDRPGAAGVQIAFAVPGVFQAFGAGERFDALDLRGQSVRYYLENFGLGSGTYLPSPFLGTTLGFGVYLPDEAPAVFHIAPSFDPEHLTFQVDGPRLEIDIFPGGLADQYAALIARIGPPLMPDDSFFTLWKAGDWRFENAATVAADEAGHAGLALPMGIKLLDAYWAGEVHSFAFDIAKYPDAQAMLDRLGAAGTGVYLWLCPWVVVGTQSFHHASAEGWLIRDAQGQQITRRPGANPNVVAALIDYSNPEAARWWSDNLRGLIAMGITGFKADFGEQLPEHAVLASGETGGRAHNAFVRYYLQATIDAFDGRTPAIISRSGSPRIRAPIWTGDQTSDFCPKTGLPSAIRAVQSASFSGWSFVGSDLGGYFGTPTPQVFARWAQFACFTPLMMLHGLGCREPWDLPGDSSAIYRRYGALHLALEPVFKHFGAVAAAGGLPMIRMMPLAFPGTDWRGINDWDQQFMLGDDLLVAPVAFYGNTRAVWLPEGDWYDVVARDWVKGSCWRVHDVPLADITLFVRAGARLVLRPDPARTDTLALSFVPPGQIGDATARPDGMTGDAGSDWPDLAVWFGPGIPWTRITQSSVRQGDGQSA
ncbi:MAG: glycoside hydrolase family 31 protein [Gemmobacter sp.]|nr:glycoside hydrolase family 31 protein [Gemmobacter sp.]